MLKKYTPAKSLVDQFRQRTPMRVSSLLMSFFGDVIAPRGGEIATSTLLRFTALFSLEQGAVRVALHRLTREGFLSSHRVGRQAFFQIPDLMRPTFEAAERRIYHVPDDHDLPQTTLYLLHQRDEFDVCADTRRLLRHGIVAPYQTGTWLSLAEPAPEVSGCIRLPISPTSDQLALMIERVWPNYDHEDAFEGFQQTYEPLIPLLKDPPSPEDAIIIRVMMVHELRRIMLKHPAFSRALSPKGWGEWVCRNTARKVYDLCLDPSETWLTEHGQNADGKLPSAELSLTQRFRFEG